MANKKVITSAVAVAAASAMLLGGTLAWQSTNQTALNEASDVINPGGRLHDDFNGENKDVYVENFADENIYARIRLDEYFEIITNYNPNNPDDPAMKTTVITEGATKLAKDTYVTHKFGEANATDDYWTWYTGGSTVYMPTFNLNKDSLEADINGEYLYEEGAITNRDGNQYSEMVVYGVDDPEDGTEIYDADANDIDEVADGTAVLDENYKEVAATHYAKDTLGATLISMDEWMNDYNSEPGEYWVYDTDGWVYWAQAIEPDTATGLLLDGIELNQVMDDTWYYAINVVAQFITADDLGKTDNTGFYDTEKGSVPSDNALALLEAIGVDVGGEEGGDEGDDEEEEIDEEYTVYYNGAPAKLAPSENEEEGNDDYFTIEISEDDLRNTGLTFTLWDNTEKEAADAEDYADINWEFGSGLNLGEEDRSFIVDGAKNEDGSCTLKYTGDAALAAGDITYSVIQVKKPDPTPGFEGDYYDASNGAIVKIVIIAGEGGETGGEPEAVPEMSIVLEGYEDYQNYNPGKYKIVGTEGVGITNITAYDVGDNDITSEIISIDENGTYYVELKEEHNQKSFVNNSGGDIKLVIEHEENMWSTETPYYIHVLTDDFLLFLGDGKPLEKTVTVEDYYNDTQITSELAGVIWKLTDESGNDVTNDYLYIGNDDYDGSFAALSIEYTPGDFEGEKFTLTATLGEDVYTLNLTFHFNVQDSDS